MTSPITSHVLDTARGCPAADVEARLEVEQDGQWRILAEDRTDSDGRIRDWLPPGYHLAPGTYRITFATGPYFRSQGIHGFYPEIPVLFEIQDQAHYHVPLLLSPYGYSTYRGS
jgi:5-hydroxyisourate hydrolase